MYACSSPSGTEEPYSVDTGEVNCDSEFILDTLWNVQPMQLGMKQLGQAGIERRGSTDHSSSRVEHPLKLVLGAPASMVLYSSRHETQRERV